ncbi:methionine synthase [Nocardia seriolae]|uniref:methionine synthase n=1 Tax=Nocardia seriolae TaxID=37332 RepID=UPI00068B09E5|nr:methionine synthase [Nocardia seriolae]MTJ61838.1 methionine synthase [Nocardia seriolae]MTJ74678.1 methionine synthase [Nocardia seriolae]MTJ90126.1 methionine synthase [Nocardia seriolae]MTK34090.1 methionine synthase [Nocardia seriolae]MTK39783.1 methionine synthase [Nocardia seriolae]
MSENAAVLRGGIATGVGSWPGTDAREAAATVVGELGQLPHLVELPARGVGADMVGRVSGLLVDMRFDSTVRGYRLTSRPGGVARRAHDLLRTDLDALEEAWETGGFAGSGRAVKVQVAGPLSVAAEVELPGGHRILTDSGALRDLSESLAEGIANHVAEVGKRLGAQVLLQIDEPHLTAVLDGTLKGVSVLNTVRAMPEPEALHVLDTVVGSQSVPVMVHTCADKPALGFLRKSAAVAVGFDMATIGTPDLDRIGELLDSGKHLVLGLVPTTAPVPATKAPAPPITWRDIAEPGVRLIDRLGFPRRRLAERILVSPACGLAGAPLPWARRALTLAAETARAYTEEPESLTFE